MLFLYLVAIFLPIPGVCIGSAPMDVGTGAFSPDGSLFQLEYACAAADRGSLAIGVEAAGAVVLVCARGNGGDDLMASSLGSSSALDALRCPSPANRKLVAISPTIGCAAGGLLPDSRVLIASARSMASDHWFAFGEPPSVASVAAEVGVVALSFSNHPRLKDHPKEKAPLRMSRPFGASLLLAAVEDEEGDADAEECSTEEEEEEEEECSANENDQGGHEQVEREGGEGGEAAMQRPTNLSASRSSDDGESDGGGNTDERRAPLLPPRRRRQRRASGRLYHLPPTGAPMRWRAKAIGTGATAAECDVAAYLLACAFRGTLSLPASEALLEEKLDPPPPPPFASAPPQQQQQHPLQLAASPPPSVQDAARAAVRALLRSLDHRSSRERRRASGGDESAQQQVEGSGQDGEGAEVEGSGGGGGGSGAAEFFQVCAADLDRVEVAVVEAEVEGPRGGGFRVLSREEARTLLLGD